MRVIISGGGTGGHVFPALAVGDELLDRGVEFMFVGTKDGLEAEVVPKKGWKIEYLSAPRWKGQGGVKRVAALFQVPVAMLKAWRILSEFRPDVVIGVGGYVSVPVLMTAVIRRVPTLIMEQNSIPGLANRLLGKFVKRVCITYPLSEKYFRPGKVIVTGNPVRDDILELPRTLPPFGDKFVLMCFGGSQGAKSINEAMLASLRHLLNKRESLRIIHQIGVNMDVDVVSDIYKKEGFDAKVYSFINNIADCYAQSHLVICRAGATSVSELMVAARPAVLVPFPYAADNHQEENARYVADNGGAVLLKNGDLTGKKVAEIVCDFMDHHERLKNMSDAMRKMAMPDAAGEIVEECFKIAC